MKRKREYKTGMAERPHNRKKVDCRNCGNSFRGNYCPECGNKAEVERLTLSDIVADSTSKSSFGSNLVLTLKMLYSRPGEMIADYLGDKRGVYTNPFALLLLASSVYGLSFVLLSQQNIGDQLLDLYGLQLSGKWGPIIHNLLNNLYIWSVLLIPLFSWGTKIVFRNSKYTRYNYTELMYAMAFWTAQTVVLGFPINIVQTLLPGFTGSWESYTIMNAGNILFMGWCFKGLYGIGWGRSMWKALLINLFTFAVITVFVLLATLTVGWVSHK